MDDFYNHYIAIINNSIVLNLIPTILIVWIIHKFSNNRWHTIEALELIGWFIICYAVISWSYSIFMMFQYPEDFVIMNRSTGGYYITFWMMFLLALIMPFSLFFAKLRKLFWYVLIVAFCIKIGYYFERFVLLTTSIHRDYELPFSDMSLLNQMLQSMAISFLKGLIITFILLLGVQVYKSVRSIYAVKNESYWKMATISNILFMGGLATGRFISLMLDGWSDQYGIGMMLEFLMLFWGIYNLKKYTT